MKTMTCRELGGKCDQELSAASWDEMVQTMTKHVMDKHPDVAKEMERMHKEDPKNGVEKRNRSGMPRLKSNPSAGQKSAEKGNYG